MRAFGAAITVPSFGRARFGAAALVDKLEFDEWRVLYEETLMYIVSSLYVVFLVRMCRKNIR